ncbi:hypothetical protein FACS1894199_19020 [Bacteroidia bacterium]|nr:hypothetical protein FACS1894199_19020 [Bacteroidia bacterium]
MYFLKKDSADGRLLTWKVSAHAIAEHPFGVGLGNFSHAYGEAQAAYFAGGRATETEEHVAGVPEYGFNEYLQIAIEAGIPSLLLFLTVLVFAFIQVARTREWGVMGALASLLVFALFSYPFSVLPFLLVFVFLLSVGGKTQKNEATQITQTTQATEIAETTPIAPLTKITKIAEKTKQLYPLFVVIPCFLLVCFCLYRQYPVYEAYKQWNTCRLYYHNGMYKQASIQYEQFYPYLNDQIKFLFEYAQSLSHTGHYQQSNVVLERAIQISCDPMLYNIMGKNCQSMKEYVQAEKYFIHATHLVPNRLYPWYLLTKLYDEMGLPAKACAAAYIVQTKEPKVQSQAIKQMRKEVKKYCK